MLLDKQFFFNNLSLNMSYKFVGWYSLKYFFFCEKGTLHKSMYINTQPPQKRSDNFQNSNKCVSSLLNHDVNMLHECNNRFLIYT